MRNDLVKKFLSYSYGSLIGMALALATTMISTRLISPVELGKASMYTLAINIVMIVCSIGTDQTFVRFFYEEKEEKRGGLLFNCLKIPFLLLVITVIIIAIFYKPISLYLFEEVNGFVMIALAAGIIFNLVFKYAGLVVRMKQRAHMCSIINIAHKVLLLITLIPFYYLINNNYAVIIYSTSISLFFVSVLSIAVERKYWKHKNAKMSELRHSNSEILKYSAPLMMTTLVIWLFNSFDKMAIRNWSDFNELGLYSAAYKIVAMLNALQATFTVFWTPLVYEMHEKDPRDTSLYKNAAFVISFVMFLLGVLAIAFKDVIGLLLGPQYRSAVVIMPFLIFMPVMYTISETTVLGINFAKKPRWHMYIAAISCIVNIIGNMWLVPLYGALGAAISTGFSYVLFFVLRTVVSVKYYKVEYKLMRTYGFTLILIVFAIANFAIKSTVINIGLSIIVIAILVAIYYKDLKSLDLISSIKKYLRNRGAKE